MENEETERWFFFIFLKNVWEHPNPPDELAKMFWKKPFRTPYFLRKFRIWPFCSIIYMIRIRFFGPGELFQKGFFRCTVTEREASAERPRFYHSFREKSASISSHFRESAGKPAALLSHRRKSSQETFSNRECVSAGHQSVQGRGETFFRFSDPEEAARTVLEEQRNHLLAEAKSEILKQECKVDTLHTCNREFQRQALSNRLEMDSVNCWYEESQREQARLHEELAQREKALEIISHPI